MPSLFIHGTADSVVPPTMSERLYAAAPAPKRLLLIEGGSHSNFSGTGIGEVRRAVAEFVTRRPARCEEPRCRGVAALSARASGGRFAQRRMKCSR